MKCIELSLLIALLLLPSCATSTKVIESDFHKLSTTKTGALLTVNLETNGLVRDDKQCYLTINDGNEHFELLIKRGVEDYALPMLTTAKAAEITKISCGPFYYYDLKNQGAAFRIREQRVNYIGFINFKLEDKGKLEWGHATSNENQLRKRARSMGLDDESLEVDLLKL